MNNSKTDQCYSELSQTDSVISPCSDSDARLGKNSPLVTLVLLSIGPVISQVVTAIYSTANSLWISHTIGPKGLDVFGAVFVVDFIPMAVSVYLSMSLQIQASYLFGAREPREVPQLFVDILRVGFLGAIAVPALVIPAVKPVVAWYGAEQDIVDMAFEYMVPLAGGSGAQSLLVICCGLLQAQGRSLLASTLQIASLVLNIGLFDPLFLVYFKTPIWGAGLATVCAQLLPGIVVASVIFAGKFEVKPSLKMFCSKFSPETKKALIVGIPEAVVVLSVQIPTFFVQKYIDMSAVAIKEYDAVVQAWSVSVRCYDVIDKVCIGVVSGMMAPVSYAYGAKRYHRAVALGLHTLWITTVACVGIAAVVLIFPTQIASLWSSDEDYLEWCNRFIPKMFYGCISFSLMYMVPGFLEGIHAVCMSTSLSISMLIVPQVIVSTILYSRNKSDPAQIMYTYTISDFIGGAVCIVFLIHPMITLRRKPKDPPFPSEAMMYTQTGDALDVLTDFAKVT